MTKRKKPKSPNKQNHNPTPNVESAQKDERAQQREPVAIAKETPSLKRKNERHCCRPDQTPWAKRMLDVLTFVAAIGVAIIYYQQLSAMHDANDINRKAIEQSDKALLLSDRPWVTINEKDGFGLRLKPNEPVGLAFHLTNFGKSPGQHTEMRLFSRYDNAPTKDFSYGELDPVRFSGHEVGPFAVMPNQDVLIQTDTTGSLVPSSTEYQQIESGEKKLYIFGVFQYQDWIGTVHHTHWCILFVPRVGGGAACGTYNDAD